MLKTSGMPQAPTPPAASPSGGRTAPGFTEYLGMAAVLLRNVLERRRELALLRAVGYNSSHFMLMVVAENAFLLLAGLVTGAVCALLAIAPVFIERGGRLPNISLGVLLLAVLISGLIASLLATWAALRSPLLPALRAE